MRIDEAGEQCGVAEVDDLGVGGNGAADRRDPISLNHDDRVARDLIRGSVEEPRRFQDDRLRLRNRRRCKEQKKKKCEFSHGRESVS